MQGRQWCVPHVKYGDSPVRKVVIVAEPSQGYSDFAHPAGHVGRFAVASILHSSSLGVATAVDWLIKHVHVPTQSFHLLVAVEALVQTAVALRYANQSDQVS